MFTGGAKGVLDNMASDGCKPDMKIFMLLLVCLPATTESESYLLNQMKVSQHEK